ncbi:hypothetical protein V1264_009896 [Littorina saxatilis]|uniref:Uncharacterized protein n=1 Tax=Littorina saxatilis TaxID=31220 RepID=A0AAN9AN42_9CAEN
MELSLSRALGCCLLLACANVLVLSRSTIDNDQPDHLKRRSLDDVKSGTNFFLNSVLILILLGMLAATAASSS